MDYAGLLEGPSALSYFHYDDDSEFPGKDELVVRGYSQMFSSGELDTSKLDVRTEAEVVRIEVKSDDKGTAEDRAESGAAERVVVTTASGDSYRAHVCVVTLPLGVLKASPPTLFSPPLPEWKQGAIDRLGVSHLNKVVYLLFPDLPPDFLSRPSFPRPSLS